MYVCIFNNIWQPYNNYFGFCRKARALSSLRFFGRWGVNEPRDCLPAGGEVCRGASELWPLKCAITCENHDQIIIKSLGHPILWAMRHYCWRNARPCPRCRTAHPLVTVGNMHRSTKAISKVCKTNGLKLPKSQPKICDQGTRRVPWSPGWPGHTKTIQNGWSMADHYRCSSQKVPKWPKWLRSKWPGLRSGRRL